MRPLQTLLAPLVLASCLLASTASAQHSGAQRAAAQVLFDDAVKLRDSGNLALACPKFAESVRLDPGAGARFNLADCYERMGRLASAWTHFLEVLASVEMAAQTARLEAVRQRVRALEPRLNRMVIQPQNPVPGLAVERDGTVVGSAQWSTAVPVDAGMHRIQATAAGYLPWSEERRVEGEGLLIRVVIPMLVPAPIERPEPETPGQPASASPQAPIGWAVGALGLVGIGVGTGFGVAALTKKSDFDAACPDPQRCTAEGLTLRDEGITAGTVSTVGFVAGGVLAAGGLLLVLTAPSSEAPRSNRTGAATPRVAIALRPSFAGGQLTLHGRF